MKSAWPALTAGFLNATELADYLVQRAFPSAKPPPHHGFRRGANEGKNSRSKPSLCDRIGPDVFDVLEYRAAVARRNAPGGTGPLSVVRQLKR